MRIYFSMIILGMLAVITGCQTNFATAESPQVITPKPGETMTSSTPDISGTESLIEMAKSDLAQRLSVSVDEIILIDARSVVWPDASLGCPQPGMVYIQIPEDGLLIRLQAGDQIYTYHSGGFRDPFLCETTYKDPRLDLFNLTPSNPPPTTPDNSIPPGEDT